MATISEEADGPGDEGAPLLVEGPHHGGSLRQLEGIAPEDDASAHALEEIGVPVGVGARD